VLGVIPIPVMGAGVCADTALLGVRGHSERRGAMSQASAGGGKRAEMERTLVQRSLEDDSFRQMLLDDPKGTVEQELATRLPENVEVRVVEEKGWWRRANRPSTWCYPAPRLPSKAKSSPISSLRRWPVAWVAT
jgi:hypothetical protein